MVRQKMGYLVAAVLIGGLLFMGWKLTSRNAYESAEYSVLKSDGPIELREYPDLMLATTEMSNGFEGNDGSFGRLFNYISGSNEGKKKIAMTTPVFMEPESDNAKAQMSFVVPEKFAEAETPIPSSKQVELTKRIGGKFAVIRYAGRADLESRVQQRAKLEGWVASQGLQAAGDAEFASYDPPWTPGPLRRNEVLVRVDVEQK